MKKYNMNELRNSDIFSHIPQMSYLPRWGVLLMDVMLCSIAFWISVWVGSGFLNYVNLDKQIVPIGSQYLIVMVGFFSIENCVLGGTSYPSKLSYSSLRLLSILVCTS